MLIWKHDLPTERKFLDVKVQAKIPSLDHVNNLLALYDVIRTLKLSNNIGSVIDAYKSISKLDCDRSL